MDPRILVAFVLGIKAAEHLHGVNHCGNMVWTNQLFQTLQQIASSEITLTATPEETAAGLPSPPPEIADRPEVQAMLRKVAEGLREQTNQVVRKEREVAAVLLQLMEPR